MILSIKFSFVIITSIQTTNAAKKKKKRNNPMLFIL